MQDYDKRKKVNCYDDLDVPPMVKYKPKQNVPPKKQAPPKRTVSENRSGTYQNSGTRKTSNARPTSSGNSSHRKPQDSRDYDIELPPQRKRTTQNVSKMSGRETSPRREPQRKRTAPPPQETRKINQNGYNNNRQNKSRANENVSKFTLFKRKYPWVQPLIVAIVIALIILGIAFATNMIGGSGEKKPESTSKKQTKEVMLTENLTAGTVQGNLRQWYNSEGGIIQDENVLNVLLLGVDDTEGETRSDAIIILSLNKSTKQINLVSIYRDSYAFVQKADGSETFGKINSAFKFGGGESAVKTVESLFKIKIDRYASVNFETFKKVIDKLGGIDIEVEEYEANYIRRTSHYTDMPFGENVHLDGEHALVYARIRKCDNDSDISRTRRQRKVVDALIKKMKSASVGQLVGLADDLLPYINTNYSKKELVSTGTEALTQNWMDYEKHEIGCTAIGENGWNKNIGGVDIVLVDYPSCAKKLQETIYGRSLITLSGDEQTRLTVNELFSQDKIYES